jgi:hypothetical protein
LYRSVLDEDDDDYEDVFLFGQSEPIARHRTNSTGPR